MKSRGKDNFGVDLKYKIVNANICLIVNFVKEINKMVMRKIIKIDEAKCNGCGICADACHEGAIEIEKGKARLIRDEYCDGLGDCLPACPTNAITFEVREADEYNEAVVKARIEKRKMQSAFASNGCPGSQAKRIDGKQRKTDENMVIDSALMQWPIQINLVPVHAPYFDGARLLIAADCSAFAYGDFHRKFMRNHITLIGCPKLDSVDYSEKLTEIIRENEIKSVTVVRMEVPCCGGIENAVKRALQESGKFIPWQVVTISTKGEILN